MKKDNADEFKCSICGKTYLAVSDQKYCTACCRIVYKSKYGNIFGRRTDNGNSRS